MHVSEAVVISLPGRRERLSQFQAGYPECLPAARVHPGVREQAPPWFHSSDSAWGCRTAHLQVLKSAWDRGISSTLVLEDDAVFAPGFGQDWEQLKKKTPSRWAMVMLGGQHARIPVPAGDLVRCTDTRRTHAYVIHLRAIPLLMRIWGTTSRHIDHASMLFQSQAYVYAPRPFLVGQAAGWSDISGKDNPLRFWHDRAETTPGLEDRIEVN